MRGVAWLGGTGRLASVSDGDRTLRVWQIDDTSRTGRPVRSIKLARRGTKDPPIACVACGAPDTVAVAIGTRVELYDVATGAALAVLSSSVDSAEAEGEPDLLVGVAHGGGDVVFSATDRSKRLVAWSVSGKARLWSHDTPHAEAIRAVHACALADRSIAIATGSDDGVVLVWLLAAGGEAAPPVRARATRDYHCALFLDSPTPPRPPYYQVDPPHRFVGHTDWVHAVHVAPGPAGSDDFLVLSGGDDDSLRLWSKAGDKAVLPTHSGCFACALAGNGLAVSCSADARLWDCATLAQASGAATGRHSSPVLDLAAGPGRLVLSVGRDGKLLAWSGGAPVSAAAANGPEAAPDEVPRAVCVDPASSAGAPLRVAVATDGGAVVMHAYDPGTRAFSFVWRIVLRGAEDACVGIAWAGGRLAVGLDDGTIALVDATSGALEMAWTNAVPVACVCAVGNRVAAGAYHGRVYLWDCSDDEDARREALVPGMGRATQLALLGREADVTLVADANGCLRLVDNALLAQLWASPTVSEWATRGFGVVVAADESFAVTATWDRRIQLWNVSEERSLAADLVVDESPTAIAAGRGFVAVGTEAGGVHVLSWD